ncbi:TPA: hypothetical protein N0F65_007810 [Lagenidium giganteum]|uniref:Transposase n=1 Tax=Lagenidium giganteum TaxID=4803 RepID=A0AAV2Z6A2_9STRA|nr:TPA: hypothetical protein N0F65_007810 [Lagenidium giganteum]
MSSWELCSFYYTKVAPWLFKYNLCCLQRKRAPRSGVSNLLSHLSTKHPAFRARYSEYAAPQVKSLDAFFIDEDTSNMFDWMRLILERNLPLCEVENPLTRSLLKIPFVTTEALKAAMQVVARRVGDAIANKSLASCSTDGRPARCICLRRQSIFAGDGESIGSSRPDQSWVWISSKRILLCLINKCTSALVYPLSTSAFWLNLGVDWPRTSCGPILATEKSDALHHSVIAVYEVNGSRRERLIGISPVEHGQTADAHIEHLQAIVDVCGKSMSQGKFHISDNCATNLAVATKDQMPVVGCASHRLNLATMPLMGALDNILDQVKRLMVALRLPNNAAVPRKHTALRAVCANATRGSSSFEMLNRYFKILDTIVCCRRPRAVVCVKLQAPDRTFAKGCTVFDDCITKHPSMTRTSARRQTPCTLQPAFEDAFVRLGSDEALSTADKFQLQPFENVMESTGAVDDEIASDYATQALRSAIKTTRHANFSSLLRTCLCHSSNQQPVTRSTGPHDLLLPALKDPADSRGPRW